MAKRFRSTWKKEIEKSPDTSSHRRLETSRVKHSSAFTYSFYCETPGSSLRVIPSARLVAYERSVADKRLVADEPLVADEHRAAESSDKSPEPSNDLGTEPARSQAPTATTKPDWSRFTANDLKLLGSVDKEKPQTGQQIADRLGIALDTPLKTLLATFRKAGLLGNKGDHKGYVRLIDLPS